MNNIFIDFLASIRWVNIFMIVLAQCLIQYFIIENPFSNNFILLIFITIASLSGGYIENNILDYELDTECKHHSKNIFLASPNAMTSVFIFYFLAVVLSWVLANNIGNFTLIYIVIGSITLLHIYNIYLKKIALVGNLSVALLATISAFLPFLIANQFIYETIFIFISIFTLSWCREWVKDLQDHLCDQLYGYKTLAIVLPVSYNQLFIILILIIYILYIFLFPFSYNYLFVIFPLVCIIQIMRKKWDLASSALKAGLFIGIISIIYL